MLAAVFGDEPHSVSQAIVDQVVTHHRAADVDRLGRGLVRYGSLNMTTIRSSERPAVYGLQRAKYEHVVLVNGNDKMVRRLLPVSLHQADRTQLEYGWDRVLLMGMKSHPDLLAVSGRAAANLYDHRTEWALVDEVGVFGQEVHDVEVSVPALDVRDVAVRSPVMYSASKVARLGGLRGAAEAVGLGDVDVSQGHRYVSTLLTVHSYVCEVDCRAGCAPTTPFPPGNSWRVPTSITIRGRCRSRAHWC